MYYPELETLAKNNPNFYSEIIDLDTLLASLYQSQLNNIDPRFISNFLNIELGVVKKIFEELCQIGFFTKKNIVFCSIENAPLFEIPDNTTFPFESYCDLCDDEHEFFESDVKVKYKCNLEAFRNETLDEYNSILDRLNNLSKSIERKPGIFHDSEISEEKLRNYVENHLDLESEGFTTGEQFNRKGKTDIIVNRNGEPFFIGECKIWNGPEEFKKAFDQLFGYLTTQDLYSSIIIFYKDKNLSKTIDKIKQLTEEQDLFFRFLEKNERVLKYKFHHPRDKILPLYLSIVIFYIES